VPEFFRSSSPFPPQLSIYPPLFEAIEAIVTDIQLEQTNRTATLLRGVGDVAVIAGTPDFEMRVRRALSGGQGPRMVRWPATGERPDPQNVAVVLIGPELTADAMVATAKEVDRECPGTYVALVAESVPGLLEKALRAGVRDVVAPSAEIAVIFDLLARGLESAQQRRLAAPIAIDAPPIDLPQNDLPHDRHIISIMAPKGGVGKTLLSVNLACALASAHRNEVALVDLDLQFGDVASSMHIAPEHSSVDAARGISRGESGLIKVFLSNHDSGVFVLAGPEDPAAAEDISYDASVAIVKQLSTAFPYVIVDTAAGLDAHALSVAEVSTDLVFVSSVDVASVRSLRKTLDALDKLGMRTQRRHLVINRSDTTGGARVEDVETALGLKAITAIPYSQTILTQVNQGSPIVYSDPKSPMSRKFYQVAESFSDSLVPATTAAKPGIGLPWKRSK
jgi:pilus assembly protein CpaE